MRPLIDDVESRMKVRKCSIVPLTPACSALSELGRTDATTAILKALKKLPKRWQLEASLRSQRAMNNHSAELVPPVGRRLNKRPTERISKPTW